MQGKLSNSSTRSDPTSFHSFTMSAELNSTYRFTSLTSTFYITNGDPGKTRLGCVSAKITPSLGRKWSDMLTFIPLGVLIMVGIATIIAGVLSPWGSTNLLKWTTNYGRDADLLRLVTPGFADCLQYIQFIFLTGGLTLSYPGFYQPVASKVAWSSLMFNQSFVSHGNGTAPVVDGLYSTTGRYGLENMSQLVGMSKPSDVWAGMAIWLLVILVGVVLAIQFGFLLQWTLHRVSMRQEEDLRHKNLPFTIGNIVRFIFIYFLLPIVALSMFQLVEAGKSPISVVALAVALLIVVLVFAGWLLKVVASTKPRSALFDDLPTLMMYGSLYNTYSDNAAPFALVPVLLTFVRGVAIGGVQPSGIAQIVLLAICEVITILTLHTFQPFHSPTSMNAYHTVFAAARFSSILLMVPFAASLGISDGTKSWIGYVILLLHGVVLIFGFLLNALQTIVEVLARLAGIGVDDNNGFAKAFGMRQLSRRLSRNNGHASRNSQSSVAMLVDRKSPALEGPHHIRSQSAGSMNMLLEGARPIDRNSSASFSPANMDNVAYTPTTTGPEGSAFSFLPSAHPDGPPQNGSGFFDLPTSDPSNRYYRAPRIRRPTMEPLSPSAQARGSFSSLDWTRRGSQASMAIADEGPSISRRATPEGFPKSPPQALGGDLALAQLGSYENRRSKTDYTTREVDFYYGVRGPALNSYVPSRKLRTGPADPTNPVSAAKGWFSNLLGGKTKEKGRGFEVVRSNRMPPGMRVPGTESPPEGVPVVASGTVRRDLDNDEPTVTLITSPGDKGKGNEAGLGSPILMKKNMNVESQPSSDDEEIEMQRIPDKAPALPILTIDTGRGLEIPSRLPSVATHNGVSRQPSKLEDEEWVDIPLPRKSSRRMTQPLGQRPNVGSPTSISTYATAKGGDYFGPIMSSTSRRTVSAQHSAQHDGAGDSKDVGKGKAKEGPLITLNDDDSHSLLDGPSPALTGLDSHVQGDRPKSVGKVNSYGVLLTDHTSDIVEGSAAEIDEVSMSRTSGSTNTRASRSTRNTIEAPESKR